MTTTANRIWCTYESPFGRLTLTAGPRGLDGLHFPGRARSLDESARRPDAFRTTIGQLDEYFAGAHRRFELPLDLSAGTRFQRAVWSELEAIGYGETASYGALAARIGRVDRIRAVGAAVGRNPLPIIVPCHRVVGADGSLIGYLGGLQRKQALLDTEAAVASGGGAPVEFGTRQLALL